MNERFYPDLKDKLKEANNLLAETILDDPKFLQTFAERQLVMIEIQTLLKSIVWAQNKSTRLCDVCEGQGITGEYENEVCSHCGYDVFLGEMQKIKSFLKEIPWV